MQTTLIRLVVLVGAFATSWQIVFLVLYFSSLLVLLPPSLASVIMQGAAVMGALGIITCYFPHLVRERFSWLKHKDGLSVALSFVVMFLGMGSVSLVLSADWISSM